MKQFYILGGLWFDKVNGNTYHNAKIIDIYGNVYYTGYKYGYDKAYLDTAKNYIKNILKINDFKIYDLGATKQKQRALKNNQF